MLKKTTAQDKIAALRKRVRIVQGGSSSSKTFTIIPFLIDYANKNAGKEISIVSESIPHLRRGAMRDFVKIMEWVGLMDYSAWNKSTLTYYFPNGSFIEFFSGDQPDKMRGARRDVLFVNEANNVAWETYYQLAIRTREFIYIDFNPTAEFWAHTELQNQPDVDFIILTYRDNEALEASIINEFKKAEEKAKTSEYWANWVRVYVNGEIGSLQGVVFENWRQCDYVPEHAKLLGYGLDYGYRNDPTALVAIHYADGVYYLDELIYQTGLLNQQISALMRSLGVDAFQSIVADSAEMKSNAELRVEGWRIIDAKKGADSVIYGVSRMQELDLRVTKRSLNLIKELRLYVWATDKDGSATNKPIHAYNHALDAVRYYFQTVTYAPDTPRMIW
jgi:phage terminase large subunit